MALLQNPISQPLELHNYIDGFWEPSAGEARDVVNPATMETIGRVPLSTPAEFDQAVQAAKAAFTTGAARRPGARPLPAAPARPDGAEL